jgi:protein-S-isoprenylcysteine O-methyltransferase Ste14
MTKWLGKSVALCKAADSYPPRSGFDMMSIMRSLFVALRAIFFATCFLLLWLWVAMRLRPLDRYLGAPLPDWARAIGVVFIFVGGSLAFTCIALFIVQGRGTPAPFDAPRQFVALGPYRIIRNPMYIGGLTMLMGLGLYRYSKAILLFCPVWFLLAHVFVILYEEPTLMSKFGTSYQGYCRAVPRWIPKW